VSVPSKAPSRLETNGRKRTVGFGEDLGGSGHSYQTSSPTKLLKGRARATE
jgi:hypothetical protein